MGNIKKVKIASQRSTTFLVFAARIIYSQMYANRDVIAVTAKTLMFLIRLDSKAGIAIIHIPVMTKRLNAAEPTMVLGPSSPDSKLFPTISIIERRISGADDPRAIRVKLATVSFQTRTSIHSLSAFGPCLATLTFLVLLVIVSIEHIKTSAMMATPIKHHNNAIK